MTAANPSNLSRRGRRAAAREAAKQAELRRRQTARRRWVPIAGVVVAAIVVVGGLIWLGNRPSAGTAVAARVGVPTDGMTEGVATAPVTIEEWADFQCPACRQFYEGAERQLEAGPIKAGRARFVWHDLAFLGQESVWAAEAARCANDQGKFWPYHDRLYDAQRAENSGTFAKANLEQLAGELGLDRAQFDRCLESDRHLADVQADVQAAHAKGVTATPTFFVNGRKLEGVPTESQLERLIAEAGG